MVYWRNLNVDWFWSWNFNRICCSVLADNKLADNVFTPGPIYLHLKGKVR
jgi:hypothetical protein